MNTAAELVRQARRGAGLTQAELARRASTSQPAVARYEAGTVSPSVATLQRLLRACGQQLRLSLAPAPRTDLSGPLGRMLRSRRGEIYRIARTHGATHVRVFGSVARGDEHADSDVDLLVDLASDRTLVDIAALTEALRDRLGVRVDVATDDLLRDGVREHALSEAIPL